jgi:hypothetical protein
LIESQGEFANELRGEGQVAARAFTVLTERERENLMTFLRGL